MYKYYECTLVAREYVRDPPPAPSLGTAPSTSSRTVHLFSELRSEIHIKTLWALFADNSPIL